MGKHYFLKTENQSLINCICQYFVLSHTYCCYRENLIVIILSLILNDRIFFFHLPQWIMCMLNNLLFPTEEDHLLLTIVDIDHDQGLVPTAQDAIDRMVAVEDIFSFSLFLLRCLILDFPKLLILPTS